MYYDKTMKIIILFVVAICLSVNSFSQESILDKQVSFAFENITLKESLKEIEKKTGINTAFNEKIVKGKQVTLSVEEALLSEVLDALVQSNKLSYEVQGNTVIIYRKEQEPQEEISKPLIKKLESYTISGYITDAQSKETLIGANIFVTQTSQGTVTNEYGFYSITLPEGEYQISFSYIGYQSTMQSISLEQDMIYSTSLTKGNSLEEVIVTDDEVSIRHMQSKMSTHNLSMEKLESMPVLMGERDVIKMVQLLPGIQSGSEGSTGLYVRGGGPDQNLILLDGVPIYNVNHMFGFLSTLNGDAIKNAEVYKGGFPARYGGRLSSIIDVRLKEGNMEEIHGNVSMGLISGKFNLEGPINKGKTSFHISGRRTWIDAITTPIQKAVQSGNRYEELNAYFFYDLNAKINLRFSDKSRLYLSSYHGNDYLKYRYTENQFSEKGDLKWGNWISSLRWNYQLAPKLFSNTTVYHSFYNFSFNDILTQGTTTVLDYKDIYSSNSKMRDYGAKIDFNFLPTPNHHIRFGAGATQHRFTPTVNFKSFEDGDGEPIETSSSAEPTKAIEASAYIENDMYLLEKFQLNAGLHYSQFHVDNISYSRLQPRLALSYQMTDFSSVKFSYSQMTQFLHLLSSPGLGLPTDLWVPSTANVKPQHSIQYALGYTHSLNKTFEITIEGYYKTMQNLLEYKSGFNIFTGSKDWDSKVLTGNGRSYGAEILLEKKKGKTTGWIGYTWSKTNRTFSEISEGESFPYKYDRRHDVSVAITHKKSDRIDFGLVWVYGTGNTYTLGTSNYSALGAGAENLVADGLLSQLLTVNHTPNRNNQRAPAYHRLDLSVNFHKQKRRGKRTWSVGLYNAYSRQNPFTVSIAQRTDSDEIYLKQTSLLPIVPFVTYSFTF